MTIRPPSRRQTTVCVRVGIPAVGTVTFSGSVPTRYVTVEIYFESYDAARTTLLLIRNTFVISIIRLLVCALSKRIPTPLAF